MLQYVHMYSLHVLYIDDMVLCSIKKTEIEGKKYNTVHKTNLRVYQFFFSLLTKQKTTVEPLN